MRTPTLLTLPLEIRLKIYRSLLHSRRYTLDETDIYPSPKTTVPLTISPEIREQRRDPSLHLCPAILRVSRQINIEAAGVLYGENRFRAHGARRFLEFLGGIGGNIGVLRILELAPEAVYYPSGSNGDGDENWAGEVWCELIDVLAMKAKGLRRLSVNFQAVLDVDALGAGRDLEFVRALGRVRQVEEMEIRGFYAVGWRGYLEGCGRRIYVPEREEEDMEELMRYQVGTEGLVP
jgi:hypothetical protein